MELLNWISANPTLSGCVASFIFAITFLVLDYALKIAQAAKGDKKT